MGLPASGGIISPVIPPSLPLILIGVAGNNSIKTLFPGGISPGLMLGAVLVAVWARRIRHEEFEVMPKASRAERRKALRESVRALFLPVIIIGGIRFGVFAPTEAAVVTAVYAIVISVAIYRKLTWTLFFTILLNAARSTAMVMFLVGAAMVAAWLITVAQLPQQLAGMLGPPVESPRLLMLVIMLIVRAVGMVMDLAPTVQILVLLLMPVITLAGIGPVYFRLMSVINASIGLITPPVGKVLNVVCGVGKVPLSKAVQGAWLFIVADLVPLLAFILVPGLVTVPMYFFIG